MFLFEYSYLFLPFIDNNEQILSPYLSFYKIVLGILAASIPIATGYSIIETLQFKNTLKSLKIISPVLIVIVLEFFVILTMSIKNVTVAGLIKFLFGLIAIGIFEEFLFRFGVLQILLSKWHNNLKEIKRAALVSGILFGLTHLLNVFSGNASYYVYGQAIMAVFIGYFLSLLYVVTKNIWGCVIFHALFDSVSMFSLCFGEKNIKNNVQTIQYSLNNASDNKIKNILLIVGFYIVVVLFSWAVYTTANKMLTIHDELTNKKEKTKTDKMLEKLFSIEKFPESLDYDEDEVEKTE